MNRFISISAAVVLAAGAALAGQIQIGQLGSGGTLNQANATNYGLTANYVNGTGGVQCVGQVVQGNTCAAPSTNGFVERNYEATLFGNATPSAIPYSGYVEAGVPAPGSTKADITNGVTFAMMSDSTVGGNGQNFWDGSGSGSAASMTIPIGIFGVTDAWMMLQNLWGTAGVNDATITFNFGANNSYTTTTSLAINLLNGVETRDAVDCTASTATGSQTSDYPGCSTNYSTSLSGTVLGNGDLSNTVNGITVLSNNLYNAGYTGISTSGTYAYTSGQLNLDDQGFLFGSSYLNDYLVSITVTDNVNTSHSSDVSLSAITLDYSSTPEPSALVLMLAGIGMMVILKVRRSKASC